MIKWVTNAFVCASVICFLYYVILRFYLKGGSDAFWVWLCAGVLFGVLGYIPRCKILVKYNYEWIWKTGVAVTIVGIVVLAILELQIYYKGMQEPIGDVDYIVVLGNGLDNGKISTILKQRLDKGYDYYQKLLESDCKFIVTGGITYEGEPYPEADAMANYLLELGVDEQDIIKQAKSTNTFEDMYYVRQLVGNECSIVVVTNRFHMWRSLLLAKKCGIQNVQGLSAPTDIVLAPYYYIREAGAIILDKCQNHI